MNMNVILKSE